MVPGKMPDPLEVDQANVFLSIAVLRRFRKISLQPYWELAKAINNAKAKFGYGKK
jgi:hypothetical protein